MITLIIALAFSQPGECSDRSPGLSKCVEYKQGAGKVICKSVCYSGKRPDGGTYAKPVDAEGKDESSCLLALKEKCKP